MWRSVADGCQATRGEWNGRGMLRRRKRSFATTGRAQGPADNLQKSQGGGWKCALAGKDPPEGQDKPSSLHPWGEFGPRGCCALAQAPPAWPGPSQASCSLLAVATHSQELLIDPGLALGKSSRFVLLIT